SSEGLPIANQLQLLLQNDAYVEIWNQGTVFGLGDAMLEALEAATITYDFGIFIFSPDDELYSRGEIKTVARDNVIFEAGLFIGKLGRRRVFVVQPQGQQIVLPTDFHGITTATFNPNATNKAAALGPVAETIRQAIDRAKVADFA
ncbi:MAG: nucleotide-binding protein, partial [Candidatus Aminicenantes bacterium]